MVIYPFDFQVWGSILRLKYRYHTLTSLFSLLTKENKNYILLYKATILFKIYSKLIFLTYHNCQVTVRESKSYSVGV